MKIIKLSLVHSRFLRTEYTTACFKAEVTDRLLVPVYSILAPGCQLPSIDLNSQEGQGPYKEVVGFKLHRILSTSRKISASIHCVDAMNAPPKIVFLPPSLLQSRLPRTYIVSKIKSIKKITVPKLETWNGRFKSSKNIFPPKEIKLPSNSNRSTNCTLSWW